MAFLLSPYLFILQDGKPVDKLHMGALFLIITIIGIVNVSIASLARQKRKLTLNSLIAIMANIMSILPIAMLAMLTATVVGSILRVMLMLFVQMVSEIINIFSTVNLVNLADYMIYFFTTVAFVITFSTLTFIISLKIFGTIENVKFNDYIQIALLASMTGLIIMTILNVLEGFHENPYGIPFACFVASIPTLFCREIEANTDPEDAKTD
jgi:hypothetical protein